MSEQSVSVVEFTEVEQGSPEGETLIGANLSVIESLEVELMVEVGSTAMSVKNLYSLKKGDIVSLNTNIDEPLKLILGDKVVAEGLLVAVDDQYGIEITNTAAVE